jgi:dienelactone hydrolase
MHCLAGGRTAMGERVWDMQRILDWAGKLPDIDSRRVLMMGNSGGGMVTLYASAVDERITVAVPSCSFCSLTSPTGYLYHCDCNMVPGILAHAEMADVAGLTAPRHMLAVNGREDRLFAVADVERAAAGAKAIFTAAECPDHFDHRFGDAGHRFYAHLMWPFVMKVLGA